MSLVGKPRAKTPSPMETMSSVPRGRGSASMGVSSLSTAMSLSAEEAATVQGISVSRPTQTLTPSSFGETTW